MDVKHKQCIAETRFKNTPFQHPLLRAVRLNPMITLTIGLIRKRPVFVYGFRPPAQVSVGVGSIALATKDLVLIASLTPLHFNSQEVSISPSNVLIDGRVRRQFCWDRAFIWPPNNAEGVINLVESGRYALILERIAEPPNIVRAYRNAISQGLIRLETILNIESAVSARPTLIGVVELRAVGKGKPFWRYPRPCLAGQYINEALSKLGVRVI